MSKMNPALAQRQFDHAALTAIAAFLRDHPAAPYSGRQCEEMVLDARDRLHGPRTIWNTLPSQPPCALGEQADVLFCGEDWGWPILGMVTRWGTPEEWTERTGSLAFYPGCEYSWSIYDQENDRFDDWNGSEPTLWLPRPNTPMWEEGAAAMERAQQEAAGG